MAQNRTWTITQSDVSRTFTISPGVGPVGPAGPNNITTATSTDITGILKGDGANVSAAVEDTDYQGVPAEGAFVDGDKTKLDGIEAGATADQTGAEIKSLYEAEADTNAFTDAEKSKLAGIEAGADVTDATNVDAAGAVMESDYSPSHSVLAQQSGTGSPSAVSLGTDSLLGRSSGAGTAIQGLTAAQARTLLNVEDGATADQTAAEILTAIKTVDGTGSGLDADLLDGQEASAFATSAQGSLADSAVQPGDIDTLAELNAIITDATLIDTTDSRLSDARTPTAHTHTASDLDFAGSTDIGADLADADEVLVSDGGGNTTRVKSALSRFWTYIKAKIDAGLTIAGNQSFSGQVELTGQAASTDDSAMTRSLVEDFFEEMRPSRFSARVNEMARTATTGSGVVRQGAAATHGTIFYQTGTTTGSTAGGNSGGNVAPNNPAAFAGDNPGKIYFNRVQIVHWKTSISANAGCLTHLNWGGGFNSVTGDPTTHAIGIKVDGSNLYLQAHNGSTLTTSGILGTVTTNVTMDLVVVSDGAGNVTLYRNGISLGSITGGPTAGFINYPVFVERASNEATTTNHTVSVLQRAIATASPY